MNPMKLVLHFDGSTTVNPGGVMRLGWHLDSDGRRVAEESGPIHGYPDAERSCNTAEFEAVLAGLEWVAAFRLAPVSALTVCGDSQLVIRILNGEWKAKKPHLKLLAEQCRLTLAEMKHPVKFVWIPRERNAEADRICG